MERRKDPRIPITFPVRMRIGDVRQFTEEHAANLSAGGIFVEMNYPPPVGTKVQLSFFLEAVQKTIRAWGVVVRQGERPNGMGIRFTHLGKDGRRLIELSVQEFNARHPSQVLEASEKMLEKLGRKA